MKDDTHTDSNEGMNRRKFLLLTVAAAAAGCKTVGAGGPTGSRTNRVVDAGPAASYAADGVYNGFRDLGFFLIRSGGKLIALSAICTHRKCKLTAEPDRSFSCDCHGSTFNPGGKVTGGPATRDLPILATHTNDAGHLMVTISAG